MSQIAADIIVGGRFNVAQTPDAYQFPKMVNPGFLGFAAGWCASSSGATALPFLSALYTLPFVSGGGGLFDQIAIFVSSSPGVASQVRLGVYNSDPGSDLPQNLLFDSGPLNRNVASGNPVTAPMNLVLTAGVLYWPCVLIDASNTNSLRSWATGLPIFGNSSTVSLMPGLCAQGQAFNPLTPTHPAIPTVAVPQASAGFPLVYLRAA